MSQFSLISTARWDGILSNDVIHAFWLLDLHRHRLLNAVLQFNEHGDVGQGKGAWEPAIKLLQSKSDFEHEVLTQFTQQADIREGPFRIRIVVPIPEVTSSKVLQVQVYKTGSLPLINFDPTSLPIAPKIKVDSDWELVVDKSSTAPSLITKHKTSSREIYNQARDRNLLKPITDVQNKTELIMYNEAGLVTEGSFTTLYFLREGRWITPSLTYGGCEATARAWLLSKQIVEEGTVHKDDITNGEWIVMSNGLRGIWGGWVGKNEY